MEANGESSFAMDVPARMTMTDRGLFEVILMRKLYTTRKAQKHESKRMNKFYRKELILIELQAKWRKLEGNQPEFKEFFFLVPVEMRRSCSITRNS